MHKKTNRLKSNSLTNIYKKFADNVSQKIHCSEQNCVNLVSLQFDAPQNFFLSKLHTCQPDEIPKSKTMPKQKF